MVSGRLTLTGEMQATPDLPRSLEPSHHLVHAWPLPLDARNRSLPRGPTAAPRLRALGWLSPWRGFPRMRGQCVLTVLVSARTSQTVRPSSGASSGLPLYLGRPPSQSCSPSLLCFSPCLGCLLNSEPLRAKTAGIRANRVPKAPSGRTWLTTSSVAPGSLSGASHRMGSSEAQGERGLASGTQSPGDPAEGRRGRRKAEVDRIHPTFMGGGRKTPPTRAGFPFLPTLSSPEASSIPQRRRPRRRGLHRTPGAPAPPLGSAPREPPGTPRRGRRDLTPSGGAESREGARAPEDAQ